MILSLKQVSLLRFGSVKKERSLMADGFTTYLNSKRSPIPGIATVLSPLDLRARKIILSVCRCQSIPIYGGKLYRQISRSYPEYEVPRIVTSSGDVVALSSIIESLSSYILDPVSNGFLQMIIKTIPLEDDDVAQAVMEGYAKEITASQERRYRPSIAIQSVMGTREERRTPLLNNWTTFNPEVHDYIFTTLKSVIPSLQQQPYYPNYGKKLLPCTSYRNFQELQDMYGYSFEGTVLGLEQFYSRTGIEGVGPTEMKQAFAYNDLRPRIYFARGSTHHHRSKYIQDIFNRIIEAFQCIHKFERFHISRLRMTKDQIFIVYDFSVFTTNLQSLSEFLHALGDFYKAVWITVIDTWEGPKRINLGDHLHDYAATCNDFPSFETFYGSMDGEPITYESGAGLLGIPGNITSSTLWHAIVLMCIVHDIMIKVVGDDAGAVLPEVERNEDAFLEAIKEFGDISKPKTEIWRYIDPLADIEKVIWQYVKRQIYRLENRICVGADPMNFPNPSLFIPNFADKHHTAKGILDPIISAIKCADRFVRECQKFSLAEQSDRVIEMCRSYHLYILKGVLKDDVRREEQGFPRFSFHRDVLNASFEDWLRGLPSMVRIPEFADGIEYPASWVEMKEYKVIMRKPVKLICDMGYGSTRMITRTVWSSETEILRRVFNNDYTPLYSFVVFEGCPVWMKELMAVSYLPPVDDNYYTQPPEYTSRDVDDIDTLFT